MVNGSIGGELMVNGSIGEWSMAVLVNGQR